MTNLKLVPVIELAPYSFQTKERDSPDGSAREVPDAWHQYWKESLADAGIDGLEPYEPGSWLVPVANILNGGYLGTVLSTEFDDYEYDADLPIDEHFGSLEGGFVLEVDGQPVAYPQCCGALENISEWEKCGVIDSAEEQMLWVGHPWLMTRSLNASTVRIRKTAEYGEPEEPVNITLDRAELVAAVNSANVELQQFVLEIKRALSSCLPIELSEKDREEVAQVFVFGR